jgi:hypothetical protein
VNPDGTTSGDTSGEGSTPAALSPTATVLPAERSSESKVWGWTAVAELLVIVLLPGLFVAWAARRRGAR